MNKGGINKMGCHTWFGRPITNEELYILKDEANKALLQEYNNPQNLFLR